MAGNPFLSGLIDAFNSFANALGPGSAAAATAPPAGATTPPAPPATPMATPTALATPTAAASPALPTPPAPPAPTSPISPTAPNPKAIPNPSPLAPPMTSGRNLPTYASGSQFTPDFPGGVGGREGAGWPAPGKNIVGAVPRFDDNGQPISIDGAPMNDDDYRKFNIIAYHENDFRPTGVNYRYDKNHTANGLLMITDTNLRWAQQQLHLKNDPKQKTSSVTGEKLDPTREATTASDLSPADQMKVGLLLARKTRLGFDNWFNFNDAAKQDANNPNVKVTEPRFMAGRPGSPGNVLAMGSGLKESPPEVAAARTNGGAKGPAGARADAGDNGTATHTDDTGQSTSQATTNNQAAPTPPAPAAPGPAASAPPGGTQPAAPAAADDVQSEYDKILAKYMEPQTSGPAWLDDLMKIAGNPLLQSALAGFYGYMSAPHGSSRWGRLGLGGLEGLKQFGEAEKTQGEADKDREEKLKTALEIPKDVAQTKESLARAAELTSESETVRADKGLLAKAAEIASDPKYKDTDYGRAAELVLSQPDLRATDANKLLTEGLNAYQRATSSAAATSERATSSAASTEERRQAAAAELAAQQPVRDAQVARDNAAANLDKWKQDHPGAEARVKYKIGDPKQTAIVEIPKDTTGEVNPGDGWAWAATGIPKAAEPQWYFNKDVAKADQWKSLPKDASQADRDALTRQGYVPSELPKGGPDTGGQVTFHIYRKGNPQEITTEKHESGWRIDQSSEWGKDYTITPPKVTGPKQILFTIRNLDNPAEVYREYHESGWNVKTAPGYGDRYTTDSVADIIKTARGGGYGETARKWESALTHGKLGGITPDDPDFKIPPDVIAQDQKDPRAVVDYLLQTFPDRFRTQQQAAHWVIDNANKY